MRLVNVFLNIYAGEFDDILDRSNSKSLSDSLEDIDIIYKDFISSSSLESNGSIPQEKHETLLEIENLILKTPSDSTLITNLSLAIKAKDNLLVRHQSPPNRKHIKTIGLCNYAFLNISILTDNRTKWKWQNFFIKSYGWSMEIWCWKDHILCKW
jgi:hypothetical protein